MDDLLHRSIHMVDMIMHKVTVDDMEKPTPCTEWDVHMLINHIVYETAWIEPLLQGKTIQEVGDMYEGDLLQGKPYENWHKHMLSAVESASNVNPKSIVHLSYGAKSAHAYLNEVACDLIIHGWDLAKSIGMVYRIDDETVQAVLEASKDVLPMARKSGTVAEALAFTGDATPMEALLAAYGRDINWKN